ncbi:MAG: hypothetical protein RBS08_10280 [Bdellovibrionales bacterium]|jgi:hypothetical protein|nr:hypothetical protein [Bdellovibrionales bacterium]
MADPVKKDAENGTELREGDFPPTAPSAAPEGDTAENTARRALMQAALATLDGWTERLHDPESGGVGPAFKKATARILRDEGVDFDMKPSAGYHSFIYPPDPGQQSFTNHVLYGAEALGNNERLMGARTHEYVHALQYQTAAALHADPFNAASNIIVSPYDYLLRKERLEQDAYVKGAWLCALAAQEAPEIIPAMEGSPLPVSTFQKIRAGSENLSEAFATAASDCRNLMGHWAKDAPKTVIADEWHARALDEYERMVKLRMEDSAKTGQPLVFVRLEDRDIHEIGSAFGANTFGSFGANTFGSFGADAGHAKLTDIENLSPAHAQKIAALAQKFGIAPRDNLPTLEQALHAAGTTRADFLAASKSYTGAAAAEAPKNDNSPAPQRQNTGPRPPSF